MASFSAGTTFTDGVANDVTAAKLGALVNNATPLSGLIQDRTAETITATNDTLLIGDASDSNALKRITVANFAQTLPTAKITTGTIETGTFGTTTSTAATITTGTITTGVIPTLTAGTTTSTAATITTGTIPTLVATTLITSGTGTAAAPAIVPTGDTNTGAFFPAADTVGISTAGTERLRIDSDGNVGIGVQNPSEVLAINGSTNIRSAIRLLNQGTNVGFIGTEAARLGSGSSNNFSISSFGTNSIVMATGSSSDERLRIDSSGNVGIGTNAPISKLSINGTNTQDGTSAYYTMNILNTATAVSGIGSGLMFGANISTTSTANNIGALAGIEGIKENGTNNNYASALKFTTRQNGGNLTERLRIDSSGNVAVGESTALFTNFSKLTVGGSTGGNGGGLVIKSNANEIGRLFFTEDGTDANTGLIRYDHSSDSMQFYTSNGTNNTERLRIDSSGFVSIGTATALSALHVHGNVTLSNTTTATSAGTGGISKPGTYAGYLTVSINGTSRKIPYYAT